METGKIILLYIKISLTREYVGSGTIWGLVKWARCPLKWPFDLSDIMESNLEPYLNNCVISNNHVQITSNPYMVFMADLCPHWASAWFLSLAGGPIWGSAKCVRLRTRNRTAEGQELWTEGDTGWWGPCAQEQVLPWDLPLMGMGRRGERGECQGPIEARVTCGVLSNFYRTLW